MKEIAVLILLILGSAFTEELRGDSRIAGGDYAVPGQFPYEVHLQLITGDNTFMCGASLIRHDWIISAAHCVRVEHLLYIQAFLGLINKVDGPVERFALIANINHIRVHPGYNPPHVLYNDLALIYLQFAQPSWLNANLNLVNLPMISDLLNNFAGMEATATGFGMTSDEPDSGTSALLRYVNMTVLSPFECGIVWGDRVTDNNICTNTTFGRSTCAGDNGGPLVTTTTDGRVILIGVGSFRSGIGCTVGHPAVFTRVTNYVGWILNTIQGFLETEE